MIEYDALIKCDLDVIVADCASRQIDMVVHDLQKIREDNHWAFPSVGEIAEQGEAWQALIPAIIASGRLIDALYDYRVLLAGEFADGKLKQWPYCEAFLPTVAHRLGFNMEEFSQFADTSLLRFRPFLNISDERLGADRLLAHPVLGGSRYIKAFVASNGGAFLMTDGFLCPQLEHESAADLAAALGTDASKLPPRDQGASPEFVDRAFGKPATQSSLSRWSEGKTPEADASNATAKSLAGDYAFHTGTEEHPWWKIDLLELCPITAVEILNRVAVDRFHRFVIETSVDDIDWNVQVEKSDNTIVSSDPARPACFVFAEEVVARYVRITLKQNSPLHLRRVRVLQPV